MPSNFTVDDKLLIASFAQSIAKFMLDLQPRLTKEQINSLHVRTVPLLRAIEELLPEMPKFGLPQSQSAPPPETHAPVLPCKWATNPNLVSGTCERCGGKWTADAPIRPRQCLGVHHG